MVDEAVKRVLACRVRQGDYRIVYSIVDLDLIVWVVKVGHRKGVYR